MCMVLEHGEPGLWSPESGRLTAMLSLMTAKKWRGCRAIFPIEPESGKSYPKSDLVTCSRNSIAPETLGKRAWDGNSEQQL